MRLYTFRDQDQKPVAVNLDLLLYAETFRRTTHGPEMTRLVFATAEYVAIDMPLAAFVDLVTR
jgi:hypothetical protein